MSSFLDDVAAKMAPRIIAAVAADPVRFARRAAVRALLSWVALALQTIALVVAVTR